MIATLARPMGWRLAQAGMVAILVGVLSFLMMRALPGDMIFRIAAARFGYDNVTAENAELVRAQIGDPSGLSAFFDWIAGLFRGDLGRSLVTGEAVSAEIAHQFGATAQLAGIAIVLSLVIGPPLGLLAGLRPGSVPGPGHGIDGLGLQGDAAIPAGPGVDRRDFHRHGSLARRRTRRVAPHDPARTDACAGTGGQYHADHPRGGGSGAWL